MGKEKLMAIRDVYEHGESIQQATIECIRFWTLDEEQYKTYHQFLMKQNKDYVEKLYFKNQNIISGLPSFHVFKEEIKLPKELYSYKNKEVK